MCTDTDRLQMPLSCAAPPKDSDVLTRTDSALEGTFDRMLRNSRVS